MDEHYRNECRTNLIILDEKKDLEKQLQSMEASIKKTSDLKMNLEQLKDENL